MTTSENSTTQDPSILPDRQCTWCQTSMVKRLVGNDRFIHYTCPKCIFQHTSKRVLDSE